VEQLLRKALEKVLSFVNKRDKIVGFTIVLVTERHYVELWRHKKKSALLVDYVAYDDSRKFPLDENGEEI